MIEADWLTSEDPEPMLAFLRHQAGERKLRLFAVACCRRVAHVISDERICGIVDVSEAYADGLAHKADLDYECAVAECAQDYEGRLSSEGEHGAVWALRGMSTDLEVYQVVHGAIETMSAIARRRPITGPLPQPRKGYNVGYVIDQRAQGQEKAEQARLLREVFGNPFRPVTVDPFWLRWNSGTITELSRGIYEERTFNRMPILADALEEAGCTNTDILSHCRQPGDHVRGCWLVDLLLGRTPT